MLRKCGSLYNFLMCLELECTDSETVTEDIMDMYRVKERQGPGKYRPDSFRIKIYEYEIV